VLKVAFHRPLPQTIPVAAMLPVRTCPLCIASFLLFVKGVSATDSLLSTGRAGGGVSGSPSSVAGSQPVASVANSTSEETVAAALSGALPTTGAPFLTTRASKGGGVVTDGPVSSGGYHNCAIIGDGVPQCWGVGADGQTTPPQGMRFRAITAGGYHTCALDEKNFAYCWGSNDKGQVTVPMSQWGSNVAFTMLSAGYKHTCAVTADGEGLRGAGRAVCWGSNANGESTPPLTARVVEVSAGGSHTCAITSSGTGICWGSRYVASPPQNLALKSLSAGYMHTCAITDVGSAYCWGMSDQGQAAPPLSGNFVSLGSGFAHTCGVTDAGLMRCWGFHDSGRCAPPAGFTFRSVSVGFAHTCAVSIHGSALCWGKDAGGVLQVPGDMEFEGSSASAIGSRAWRDANFVLLASFVASVF